MDNNFFRHKVVLITGSTQGIGKTTAAMMLKAGAHVVINGRNAERLQEAYEELSPLGTVLPLQGDVSQWEDVQAMIGKTLEEMGRLDILICNAGLKFEDSFRRTTPETLQQILQVNFLGAVYPVKASWEALQQTQGSAILIGSLAGLFGLPGAGIYSAAKMALAAIQQSLEAEFSPHHIHIGLMYVGLTENDEHSGILNGNGEKLPFPDRKMYRQPQEVVARALMRMAEHRIRRKVMTPLGVMMDMLLRVSPSLLRLILARRTAQIAASL